MHSWNQIGHQLTWVTYSKKGEGLKGVIWFTSAKCVLQLRIASISIMQFYKREHRNFNIRDQKWSLYAATEERICTNRINNRKLSYIPSTFQCPEILKNRDPDTLAKEITFWQLSETRAPNLSQTEITFWFGTPFDSQLLFDSQPRPSSQLFSA